MRDQNAAFPPAVALVTADGPQHHVGGAVGRLLALLEVQHADARPEHVVPEGHAEVVVGGADHGADQPSHLRLLVPRGQGVDEVAGAPCQSDAQSESV